MLLRRLVVGALQTNCYLVGDDDGQGVLIDPGGDAEAIIRALREENLTVLYVLNTHGHPDHTAADADVVRISAARVAIHSLDRVWIEREVEEASVYELTDGLALMAGKLELKVIHTAGHTQGSVCFMLNDILFSGDLLFRRSVGRTDLPGGSHQELMRSLKEKIMPLPPLTRILPGHGEETTLKEELESNPFLRRLL